ncbi:conserved hypothetical protein [Bacillus cereus ATCC 10987]|uniref:Uncharacterized protein n=1 Tax=Bacillus cereus (strain ATCC 10987 / NRS 248) TaxID=222523 RepID=Q72ZP4_BACC1|nr:conserved hypothetical protein [Bacillus cereus ATCC 10987]
MLVQKNEAFLWLHFYLISNFIVVIMQMFILVMYYLIIVDHSFVELNEQVNPLFSFLLFVFHSDLSFFPVLVQLIF